MRLSFISESRSILSLIPSPAVAKTPEGKLATTSNAGKHDGVFEKTRLPRYPQFPLHW